MMTRMICGAAVAAAMVIGLGGSASAADIVKLDAEKSKIGFVGTTPDDKHVGGFKKFKADAMADYENPSAGTLEITIDTTSLWSDDEKLTGLLTMLGKTVEVTVPAKVDANDEEITLTSEFKIDRTKWGMNYGAGKIDNEVAISAVLVFAR